MFYAANIGNYFITSKYFRVFFLYYVAKSGKYFKKPDEKTSSPLV